MKSLQHVLWRGALALSLMAVGIGSGLSMPSAERAASPAACPAGARVLVADEFPATPDGDRAAVIVLRRALTPAG